MIQLLDCKDGVGIFAPKRLSSKGGTIEPFSRDRTEQNRDKPVSESLFHWLQDVTAMENYIWTALINKAKFCKLSDTRDLRSNLACLDFHVPLYGFEARAIEVLLWS